MKFDTIGWSTTKVGTGAYKGRIYGVRYQKPTVDLYSTTGANRAEVVRRLKKRVVVLRRANNRLKSNPPRRNPATKAPTGKTKEVVDAIINIFQKDPKATFHPSLFTMTGYRANTAPAIRWLKKMGTLRIAYRNLDGEPVYGLATQSNPGLRWGGNHVYQSEQNWKHEQAVKARDAITRWVIVPVPKGTIIPAKGAKKRYAKDQREAHSKAITLLGERDERGSVLYYREDAPGTKHWVGEHGVRGNPPKRGNRWRMDDGSIVTSDQLKRKFFGKLPSPTQRRMLGIKKITIHSNPSHKGKTMARKNPYRRTPINKSKAIPKGKRAGERFSRDGKTFVVISYVTHTGKRVRYARRVKAKR